MTSAIPSAKRDPVAKKAHCSISRFWNAQSCKVLVHDPSWKLLYGAL
jgi:hypothetical protein